MKVISLSNVSKMEVTMEGASRAWKQVPISGRDGAPVYALRVFTIEPGGYTPYHSHDFEHSNYVIEGEGSLVDEQGKETPLKAGDFALVLPGEKHRYRNVSPDKIFRMICGVPKAYE